MEEMNLDVPVGGDSHSKAPENTDPSLSCEQNIVWLPDYQKYFNPPTLYGLFFADPNRKPELSSHTTSHPRLEPFSPGQVYNSSKAQQVHVLPSATVSSATDTSIP
jgi:hypothetical protein